MTRLSLLYPAEMRQFHRIIFEHTDRMRALIADLLDVARIETAYAQTRAFYEAMGFLPLVELQQEGWTDPTLIMVRHL